MKPRPRRWLQATIVCVFLFGVLPTTLVLPWRWIDPPTSSFISRARSEGFDVHQDWVDLGCKCLPSCRSPWSPPRTRISLTISVSISSRFDPPWGRIDRGSVVPAPSRNRWRRIYFSGRGTAGSAKGSRRTSPSFVEILWPKRRILEIYLNIAEFGPGVFGAEAAARRFFGQPAKNVTARQAAILAAVLPNPKHLSAAKPTRYVEERVAWILRQMKQLGGPAYLEAI